MKDKRLYDLKEKYEDLPIPEKLEAVVKKAIVDGRKDKKNIPAWQKFGAVAAGIILIAAGFTAGLNTSPAFANTMAKIPGVGQMAKVLTFKEYLVEEDTVYGKIEIPAIQDLGDSELEEMLNEKYLTEGENLYADLIREIDELKEAGGHLGVDSGYTIKTDTERILSIERYIVNTVASSSTELRYDTIDKELKIILTLPELFKDESYVERISENIKSQMLKQMKEDENIMYWLAREDEELFVEEFSSISPEENFYINEHNKLVIVFDKYEVAPGYMGNPEFEIPTEILTDILTNGEYLK